MDNEIATPDWIGRRAVALHATGSGTPFYDGIVEAVSEDGEYACVADYRYRTIKFWHRTKHVRLAAVAEEKPDSEPIGWFARFMQRMSHAQ